MSDSIQQWILKDLNQYAQDNGAHMGRNLMQAQKGRKCQIVKFIAPHTENPLATVWGIVSDKECWIPVKFEQEAMTRYENTHQGQDKLRSQVGAVCTLRDIKLLFTKIPLDGKVGLSDRDHLVLQVGHVRINGVKGEPAFQMDVVDKNGISRRKEPITSDQDSLIGKWVNGLRSGNGHVIQSERVEKKGRAELGAGKRKAHTVSIAPVQRSAGGESRTAGFSQISDITPPATPTAPPARITREEPVNDWSVPEDQKELFVRYEGRGPPSPESDAFSDEAEEEEEEGDLSMPGVKNIDDEEPASSPSTVAYSGWFSSPQKRRIETGEEESREESEEEEPEINGSPEADIPCAQPPKLDSSLDFSFLPTAELKEEPISQALPAEEAPSSGEANQSRVNLSLSWPSAPSKDAEYAEPEGQPEEKVSQMSSVTTIEPNSSNEVSCSALFPPAQRSAANLDEPSQSPHNSDSDSDNGDPLVGTAEGPFDELGYDDAAEKILEEFERKSKAPSPSFHEIDDKRISIKQEDDLSRSFKKFSSPPDSFPFGGGFDLDEPSVFNPAKPEPVSTKLESEGGRSVKGRMPEATLPSNRKSPASLKRRLYDVESIPAGSNKRLKTAQRPLRETLARAASPKSYAHTPQSSTPLVGSSSVMRAPVPSESRRPLLMGNGKPLTLWRSLQKNPPPEPSRSHSSLMNALDARPPFLDLTKMAAATKRRSTKYKRPLDS